MSRLRCFWNVIANAKFKYASAITTFLLGTGFFFQNCAPVKFSSVPQAPPPPSASGAVVGNGEDNGIASPVVIQTVTTCNFNGQVVADGGSVQAYLTSSVLAGAACQSQTRLCRQGELSGNYQFASCTVDAFASCMFNSQTVEHGQGVIAYSASSVPYGSPCLPQNRMCNNGQLSGDGGFAACTPGMPESCLFNGQTIAHGNFVNAYAVSTVAYGQACIPIKRTCNNGQLSDSGDFASCVPNDPKSCLFNGLTIVSGQSVPAYETSSVAPGEQCKMEDRVCTNGDLSGTYSKPSCVVNTALRKELTITEKVSWSPFKLLLVIDDSTSMQNNQDKIAANIDSLLLPLKDKDVEVRIITTSDRRYNYYTKREASTKDVNGNIRLFPDGQYEGYNDPNIVSIREEVWHGPASGVSYSLNSRDPQEKLDATIAAMKTYIKNIGTNGDNDEKVMCPVARYVYDTGENAFFKQGDRAAVVVLSDENDSSTQQECSAGFIRTYGELTPGQTRPAYKQYEFDIKAVRVKFSYKKTTHAVFRDGVLVSPETKDVSMTDGSVLLGPSIVPLAIASSDEAECKRKAKAYLTGLGVMDMSTYGTSYDFRNADVSFCKVEQRHVAQIGFGTNEVSSNFCESGTTFQGMTLEQYATDSYVYGDAFYESEPRYLTSYSHLQGHWFPSYKATYAGNCTPTLKPAYTYNPSRNSEEFVYKYYVPGGGTLSNVAFDSEVINKMKSLFDNKFFVSFIIKKSDNTCTTTAGVKGVRYEKIATDNPTLASTYPICETYGPALDKVSDFAIQQTVALYDMGIPDNAIPQKVSILRLNSTTPEVLGLDMYDIIGGKKIQLKLNVLEAGDKILIDYYVP